MNGKRYILDTNAIVYLLRGNETLLETVSQADWVGISIVSKLEFLCFSNLTEKEKNLFEKFLKRIYVVDLAEDNHSLVNMIIDIRKKYKIKIPDAIVVASAIIENCILITEDKQLQKIDEVSFLSNFSNYR